MSGVVALETRAKDVLRIATLEKQIAQYEARLASIRTAIGERRFGDALALTRPTTVTAPISASGDLG